MGPALRPAVTRTDFASRGGFADLGADVVLDGGQAAHAHHAQRLDQAQALEQIFWRGQNFFRRSAGESFDQDADEAFHGGGFGAQSAYICTRPSTTSTQMNVGV